MYDLALRMEIIKPFQDHPNQNFDDIRRYDIANESLTIHPKGFTQGLRDSTSMFGVGAPQCEGIP